VLSSYKLDEFVSQGAYGAVYKATCIKNNRTVAIKMIGNFRDHEYHCVQVLREIQLMRALNAMQKGNGCVPQLLDLIMSSEEADQDTRIFLVMEYCEYDLRSLCMGDLAHLSSEQVISIVYEILCCLKFMHSAGVVHRDIKPSNIFLTKDYKVKIGDLGVSRSLPLPILGPGSCNTKRLRDSFLKYQHSKRDIDSENLNQLISQKVIQNTEILR